jgi:hypothetical protein
VLASPVGLPKRSREFIVKKADEPAENKNHKRNRTEYTPIAVSVVTRGNVGAGTTVGADVVGAKLSNKQDDYNKHTLKMH